MLAALREKLARTRAALRGRLDELFRSDKPRDELLDELAETLILADVGVPATDRIVAAIRETTKKSASPEELKAALKAEVVRILARYPAALRLDGVPSVVLMVGVNGGGKTTSLAKLARRLKDEGRRVLLVAADTFRAAAQEQLGVWAKRLDVPIVKGGSGADPAAVVFDAAKMLAARRLDVMLVDTAGRVPTNANLMAELEKIGRVVGREIPGAPQEVLLVLDATVGQNALAQARQFLKVAGLTGVCLTKLDGTAKGGSVIGIAEELRVPIKLVGTGEGLEDMEEFSPEEFAEALLA